MIYVILVIVIILNFFALQLRIDTMLVTVILSSFIGCIRGLCSESFRDIFNLRPFIIKLETKENVIELVSAFLFSLIVFEDVIIANDFAVDDFIYLIVFTCTTYRFLLYNFSVIIKGSQYRKR